jgi:hypothetical protein
MAMLRLWHRVRRNYLLLLADSCLDENYKRELLEKARYHDILGC